MGAILDDVKASVQGEFQGSAESGVYGSNIGSNNQVNIGGFPFDAFPNFGGTSSTLKVTGSVNNTVFYALAAVTALAGIVWLKAKGAGRGAR